MHKYGAGCFCQIENFCNASEKQKRISYGISGTERNETTERGRERERANKKTITNVYSVQKW